MPLIKRQRHGALIEPVHAEEAPVRAYVEWISGIKGVKYHVVTVPKGSMAYGMGCRYVSVPGDELDYYLANGADLVEG